MGRLPCRLLGFMRQDVLLVSLAWGFTDICELRCDDIAHDYFWLCQAMQYMIHCGFTFILQFLAFERSTHGD